MDSSSRQSYAAAPCGSSLRLTLGPAAERYRSKVFWRRFSEGADVLRCPAPDLAPSHGGAPDQKKRLREPLRGVIRFPLENSPAP